MVQRIAASRSVSPNQFFPPGKARQPELGSLQQKARWINSTQNQSPAKSQGERRGGAVRVGLKMTATADLFFSGPFQSSYGLSLLMSKFINFAFRFVRHQILMLLLQFALAQAQENCAFGVRVFFGDVYANPEKKKSLIRVVFNTPTESKDYKLNFENSTFNCNQTLILAKDINLAGAKDTYISTCEVTKWSLKKQQRKVSYNLTSAHCTKVLSFQLKVTSPDYLGGQDYIVLGGWHINEYGGIQNQIQATIAANQNFTGFVYLGGQIFGDQKATSYNRYLQFLSSSQKYTARFPFLFVAGEVEQQFGSLFLESFKMPKIVSEDKLLYSATVGYNHFSLLYNVSQQNQDQHLDVLREEYLSGQVHKSFDWYIPLLGQPLRCSGESKYCQLKRLTKLTEYWDGQARLVLSGQYYRYERQYPIDKDEGVDRNVSQAFKKAHPINVIQFNAGSANLVNDNPVLKNYTVLSSGRTGFGLLTIRNSTMLEYRSIAEDGSQLDRFVLEEQFSVLGFTIVVLGAGLATFLVGTVLVVRSCRKNKMGMLGQEESDD